MSPEMIKQINSVVGKIKKFIEQDEPYEVPSYKELSKYSDFMTAYQEFVNYDNKLTNHLKEVDYLIYYLTDGKSLVSDNTSQGQKIIKSLNAQINTLERLRDCLRRINDQHILVNKYFEKCSNQNNNQW